MQLVADLLEQRRIHRFVFLSSGAVYEGLTGPISPHTRPEPLHPYAVCKLAAERLIKHARREEMIEEYVILRLFGAYGPGEPTHKLPTRLLQAPAGEPFTIAGNGLNLVDYLYVDDAVQRILAVATSQLHDITLDLAGNMPLSVKAFAQEVRPDLALHFKGRASEPITFWSCCQRYRDYFGDPTTTPLSVGIAKLKESLHE
jgi:nucleoside-diphosphate-sugar epimerase